VKYQHILAAIRSEVWAIDPRKGEIIARFIAFAASGGRYSESERAEKIGAPQARNIRERSGSTAIIGLHGVMSQRISLIEQSSGGCSSDEVRQAVNAAVADDAVKCIMLHVDSPGGSLYGTAELAAAVRAARDTKTVIAMVDSVAASAAYWVASQATEICMTPGGDVGSIGVYSMHEDLSKALEAEGVKTTLVYAGEHKIDGNPFEPLSEAAKVQLQSRVDGAYRDFVSAVAAGRGVVTKDVEANYGQGRTLSAKDALASGMVDRIATFDETLARYARPQSSNQNYARRAQVAAAKAAV
jgi:signal peptide peptidase SppA